ncbi:MNIO family bufferin maturase [Pseudomonas putida]
MNGNCRMGAGLSLKAEHFAQAVACAADGLWFEVHPENYMVGGQRLAWLERVAARHPLSLHGVALSLAADAAPDALHLRRLKDLVERVNPALVSEHLAWSTWRGSYYPDLLPFPRSHAALLRITENIQRTQEALGRCISIENPSHYLPIEGHDWDETDFLGELARRSGCGLLLDVNNVYVSAHNLGFDATGYLERFPTHAITEVHLAGHHLDDQGALLIDSHDSAIAKPVWALYRQLIQRTGACPTLIERDGQIPAFSELLGEREIAQATLDLAGETA